MPDYNLRVRCEEMICARVSPALRMLSTEIWDDVEEARVGALWVIFQDTGIDILRQER